MGGGVFVIKSDDTLVEMNEQPYNTEDVLQHLVAKYPNLLAGDQMNVTSPRKWVLISREVGLPSHDAGSDRWSVDHLFVDQDAVPTLVEVKRSTDTRIRREVVGQMLEYAANAVLYWPVERIIGRFEAQCAERGIEPGTELRELLGEDEDISEFWARVQDNLRVGKVRLVFVADAIPDELRRIIEFINRQMNPAEVLGVEIKQYVGESLKTLVPRVIGLTSEAVAVKRGPSEKGTQWNRESFMNAIEDELDCEVAQHILDWCGLHITRVWWGFGKTEGSFVPVFNYNGVDYQVFAVRTGTNNGPSVELYFRYHQSRTVFEPEEKRLSLLQRINRVLDEPLSEGVITRQPKIPLKVLRDARKLEGFLAAYEWFVEQVRTND